MILFITRKYPPSVGGMEQLSYHLTQNVDQRVATQVIKWGGRQIWLPLFIPFALVQALLILQIKPVTLIHLGDLVLAPLGLLLRLVARRPVVANAHGLDVIYPSKLYQALIPRCAKRLDFVICNSESTRLHCLSRGIEAKRTRVIPVGVEPETFETSLPDAEQLHWLSRWRLSPRPERLLLTVGRLVPRKGVVFFISEVLPKLIQRGWDLVYVVAGKGPELQAIEAAVRDQGVQESVRLLGQVSAEELRAVYAMADLFVMPNLSIEGDSEGFGIVTLEARMAGLRIVASALQGIVDSFDSANDGILVPPGNADALVEAVARLLETELTIEERQLRRHRTSTRYGWAHIADEYLSTFSEVQAQYHMENRVEKSQEQ